MNVADLFATLRITPNQKSFDAADRLISGVQTALTGLAAIAGAHALAGMVEDTVELGGHINDLAQETDVAAESLQVIGYAAGQNSSTMDEAGAVLNKLSKNMAEAAAGGKSQAEAFSAMGVKIHDASGKIRPVEDVFEDIAINQAQMTDSTKKSAAIMDVLGKSGKALIPTMNDIASRGLPAITAEAESLGAVMSEDAIKALDEFGDTQDKVKAGLIGLRNQAVIALLPTLQKLADSFLEWVKVNRAMIAQKLQTVIGFLIKALQGVAFAANMVLKVFDFLEKHWDIIKVSVLALAGAMLLFKTASIEAAIASGAAWAVANIPLVLLAALLAGLILLVEDVVTAFEGGDSVLQKFFHDRFGVDLVDTLTRSASAIRFAFEAVVDWATRQLDSLIDKGEKVGKFIYELIHGDTQAQADRDSAPDFSFNGQARVGARRRAKAAGFDEGALAAIGLGPEFEGGIDRVVKAPEGIDKYVRAPASQSTVTITAPVTVKIDGATGTPEQNAKAVSDAMSDFFHQQIVIAASGIGGVK